MLASSSRSRLSLSTQCSRDSVLSRRPFQHAITEFFAKSQQQRGFQSSATARQFSLKTRTDGNQSPRRRVYAPRADGRANAPLRYQTDQMRPLQAQGIDQQRSSSNVELARLADRRQVISILDVLGKMKKSNVKPDLFTYNAVLDGFSRMGLGVEAFAVLDDMKAFGIEPDVQSYNHVLRAARHHNLVRCLEILSVMKKAGLEPNTHTYNIIISHSVASSNLEMSLRLLVEMEELGFSPKMEIAQSLIILAAELGHPRLAIDLTYNFEASSVRKLDGKVWESCLAASAESYYKDGVVSMWPKVVHEHKMTLDEGLCLNALHTAGRHGLPDLAMEIFRTIKSIGIPLREHHFAPILEAAARTGRIKDAFSVLSLMRASHIVPESATAHPIFQALQESPASVDAAWDVLEELHKGKETIDILAINVIIQASISHGDLQRAIGIYQSISRFGLKPNVDTFNALLSGCIAARNRELGDRLLTDMREGGIVPDAQTYERLVVLCLTAPTYEDAFFYLEEMKAADHFPPYSVYEAIIRRCISEGDSRYQLALQELGEFGYQVTPRLQELIDSHDQSHSGERESTFDEVAARRRS